jgi:HEAT repeat protein
MPTFGQAEDWPSLLRALASKEQTVKAAAQQRLFGALPELSKREASQIDSDVSLMLLAFEQDQSVRVEVSAVLSALASARPDSAIALKSAVPAWLTHLKDSHVQVRRNAAFSILNLKPSIPDIAVQPLVEASKDPDSQTFRAAIFSLARVCETAPIAVETLRGLLVTDHPDNKPRKLQALSAVGWARCESPDILTAFIRTLDDVDNEIVLAAIRSAAQFGSRRSVLRPELERVAQTHSDRTVAAEAAAVVSGLR